MSNEDPSHFLNKTEAMNLNMALELAVSESKFLRGALPPHAVPDLMGTKNRPSLFDYDGHRLLLRSLDNAENLARAVNSWVFKRQGPTK